MKAEREDFMHYKESEALYHKFMQTSRMTSQTTHEALEKVGLYKGQPPLLFLLWEKDGQSRSELREVMGTQPATITKMVARLEKNGFVCSRQDEKDLRVSRVYLTDKGKGIEENVSYIFKNLNRQVFSGFNEEELIVFSETLDRIRENIRKLKPIEFKEGDKL